MCIEVAGVPSVPEPFDVVGNPHKAQVRFDDDRLGASVRVVPEFTPYDRLFQMTEGGDHRFIPSSRTAGATVLDIVQVRAGQVLLLTPGRCGRW